MSEVIIRAENIGKRYTLNHLKNGGGGGYQRFSESLAYWAKTPLRWAQKVKAESGKLKLGTQTTEGENPLQLSAFNSQLSSKEDFWALKDINFEIKQGEVVGIIGRNGAGKSTLLKILSRITEPTTGRITLKGRVASLLEVGTGFHPELTGRENIFLNGAILGMHRHEIKAKFDEIVAFAEIEKFLDTPVKRYSSGMYVRLAFAVAAHLEPEILIVDEVLAVGDAQFQAKCLGKMQDVARGSGRTVLFVSHNMGAVKSLCGRGLMMSRGQIIQSGPVEDVIATYLRQAHTSGNFKPNSGCESHIKDCQLLHTNGQPATAPFTNDELLVAITYMNLHTIKGLRVGFSIASADGAVITVCTPEDEGVITPDGKGEHRVVAKLPKNSLMKGAHQISASLWHGAQGIVYDEQPNIAQFQIEAAKERAYVSEFSRAGVFQLPATWLVNN